ncbi:PREDICTED: uncharacterized abhydrolase domain-containing protein DDB_G0269086-like isoform X2 [Lupinus angustifolius]|uniref:uncharacterized abhydrolase domain-containing protein DDB_G0269086-like isoform X2 n=1 Tax=Lupinus angustifolius TaxID=3871 RepID=UPI00092FC2E8|nr:PREDICTED: uncharacterized abhydrolase domain-containing protein DDB_G0269086-like isoform X2 [Lupinus angustifolius]
MATETDHASVTDEQIVNKEKSEAIADMIASLANEDAVKHDNLEDANGGHTTPSSKTEGDETNGEPGAIEVQKSDDSPAIRDSAEDNLKHDKIEDALIPIAPLSKTEEDGTNAEPAVVVVEKNDDPVSLETHIGDKLKEEKKVIDDSNATDDAAKSQLEEPPFTEPTVEETPQQLEKEATEPKTDDILEASEAEFVKEAEIFETSDQKEQKPEIEPEPVATEVQEKTRELGKELDAEVVKEAEFLEASDKKEEKPETGPEPAVVATEVQEITQEPKKESEGKVVKEAELFETPKAELVVTEVEENPKEPENQSLDQKEEEQPNTVAIAEVSSTETSEAIEEKASEPEVLKETNDYEAEPTETEKAELVVPKVDENSSEQEKESLKQEEEELPKTVIPETATAGDTVEVHPPKESDIEVVKEIDNSESEAVPGEAEKPDVVSAVHQPIVSDIEAVKETGTSELEVKPEKGEKLEPVPTEVEENPRELVVEAAENVGEPSKEEETKQEIVLETTNNEEEKTDTIKDPISLKEDKTFKGEETSITANTAQFSGNEEAQAAPENLVEPLTEVAEKVFGEESKKESSFSDVTERVSKDVAGILAIPGQASVDQEAIGDLIEETRFEEKVVVAENDDKKEPEAPEAVHVSSREAEVEINKEEKQIEVKTATTEDDGPAVENEKGGYIDTKVDEISSAVREPVRETLASKFEEEETTKTELDDLEKEHTEEPLKTEVQVLEEPTKDLPKETPAKPAQKQSNNIISKVKQSLVKARKAIIGKSPSSKNHSTEAKDDIQVK